MATNDRYPTSRIDMLFSLTGARQYFEDARAQEALIYDQIHEGSVALKQALNKHVSRTNAKQFGKDKLAIRRIIRPFEAAADAHIESQKGLWLAWNNLLAMFPPEPPKSSSGEFNPNK